MKNYLSLVLILCIGVIGMPIAAAQTHSPQAKKTAEPKKTAKKAAPVDEDDKEPETTGSSTTTFDCELGNSITIYQNPDDDKHIALRWKKRLHRMTRIGTTTGANRFENRKYGLVWLNIPAKGILLDSKKGQQLANECKVLTEK